MNRSWSHRYLELRTTLASGFQILRSERANQRIIGGSLIMLVGSGFVSLVNLGYNIAVARMLGPSDFGQAAAAVTLLMLFSAITLAFQLVCAKFIARNETPGGKAAVYAALRRRSWAVGLAVGTLLILCSAPVAHYLRLPSASLVVLLALGIAFYIPLGVKRGGLQGICSFRRLTANFVLEAVVRFVGTIILIHAGLGVIGAVGSISASVIIAYFLPLTPDELSDTPGTGVPASFREGIQAIVFFVGQVIINNVDILLVKHFFAADAAGLYAAVALVGRVVYFFSWSVISAMFPISAQAKAQEENSSVLAIPLLLVLGISVIFAFGLGAFPDPILRAIFGSNFQTAAHGLDSLLMFYAASTGAYSLAVVLMAYEMSRKLANSGWIQLAFSGAIVFGISVFHSNLKQVVLVQLVLMVVLFITAAMPFFRSRSMQKPQPVHYEPPHVGVPAFNGMKRIRRVEEAEVIAEFLKNEFHHPEFERDRLLFQKWVKDPDISSDAENALRRALLFRRRESMWREIPQDTEWWQVEISASDLSRIRVFPRAQWRKVASGSFLLTDIVQRMRDSKSINSRTAAFISRLQALSARLRVHSDRSGVMLIGIDESEPLTIIEGNHRITAAMLASPSIALQRFRYFCGFSPHMRECCWYQTNLTNLSRYARNRVKVLMYDREAEITRILSHHAPEILGTANIPRADSQMREPDDLIQKEAS